MIKKIITKLFHNDVSKNIVGIFAIKVASMGLSFFSMPLYIKYFGNDSILGAWYTLLSIVNWVYIFDFGMGNSLRNKLVFAINRKDYKSGREYIETSYTIVSLVGIVFIVGVFVAVQFVNLNAILDVPDTVISSEILKSAVLLLLIGVILCFLLKTINAVLFAFQKAMFTSISTLATSVIMLLFVLLYNSSDQEHAFLVLACVHAFAVVIPLLVMTVIVFSTKIGKALRPHRLRFKSGRYKELLSLGVCFFIIQLLSLFVISTNELMITNFFSSADVVEYSIYQKVFNMASSVVVLAVAPVWSKITQYISQNNYTAVDKVYRRLLTIGGIACGLIFLMVPLLQIGFNIWLRSETILVNYVYALIFAAYTCSYVFSILLTTVANGMGKLKIQLIFYGTAAVIKIPFILLVSWIYSSWVVVLLAVFVPFFAFCIAQGISNKRIINKQIKEPILNTDAHVE